jgi:hypothetical protein
MGMGIGSCECGNELLGSVKCWVFLDKLRTYQFLKKNPAPWN